MAKKLYRNMHLFTPVDGGKPLAGAEQARVKEIKKAAMLVSGGIIEKIGEEEEILKNVCPCEVAIEKDFGGACVIPGFVDPHTHMCFAKHTRSRVECASPAFTTLKYSSAAAAYSPPSTP